VERRFSLPVPVTLNFFDTFFFVFILGIQLSKKLKVKIKMYQMALGNFCILKFQFYNFSIPGQ
jgi:hypothetical protein